MTTRSSTRTRAAAQTDAVFVALADSTRRDLLRAVIDRGPVTATQLAESLTISRQGVSKHLQGLADAGLVAVEHVGREARYEADLAPLSNATVWLRDTESAWVTRLDRLRRKVERRG